MIIGKEHFESDISPGYFFSSSHPVRPTTLQLHHPSILATVPTIVVEPDTESTPNRRNHYENSDATATTTTAAGTKTKQTNYESCCAGTNAGSSGHGNGANAAINERRPRKLSSLSTASIRRHFSGCFKKQDSNEWPIMPSPGNRDNNRDMRRSTESLASPVIQRKISWYKKLNTALHFPVRSVSSHCLDGFRDYSSRQEPAAKNQETNTKKGNKPPVQIPGAPTRSASGFLVASYAPFLPVESHKHGQNTSSDSNLNDIYFRSRWAALQPGATRASFHGPGGVGSAESLVGRVLREQGLGKYIDKNVVQAAQRELAEAFNMTQEGLLIFLSSS